MAKQPPFVLVYDLDVAAHLSAIEPKYHSLIRTEVEEQLRFTPEAATRNRKPLERSIEEVQRWELRFGPGNQFRAFYRVDADRREVRILAIGVKIKNRLFIAGKEVQL